MDFERACLVATLLLSFLSGIVAPVAAQTWADENTTQDASETLNMSPELRTKFRELDTKLILTTVDLARFNVAFRQGANVRWKWRDILYPAAQEATTACTLSNALVDLKERADGLQNLDAISSRARKQGLAAAGTGSTIGAASSAAELTQNLFVCYLESKKGFSPSKSLAFVQEKRSVLHSAFAERQKLIDELPEGKVKELRKLESLILRRASNQLLREFVLWSADSRARMWRENTFYGLDVTQQIMNLVSSALASRSIDNSVYSKPSAVCGLISKSIATTNPIIRTIAGDIVRKHQIKHLSAELAEQRVDRIKKLMEPWGDEERVLATAARNGGTDRQIEELEILSTHSLTLDSTFDRERMQLERLQRVADQQAISGPAIGMLSLSQQILNTVAAYRYANKPEISNRIKFAGRIPQVVGLSYSLINTPTSQALNILKNRKLRKEGRLPAQALKQRLQNLDEIEKRVNSWTVR